VAFTIGNLSYIASGYDGITRYNDLWSFDPAGNANTGSWAELASMPKTNATGGGTIRSSGVGFSIDSLGYVGTGYDGYNPMKDFWQYSPATNTWTQKADFTGGARYDAVAFGIGSFGYVTTGYDGLTDHNDNWQYDPANDVWTEKVSMPGQKRSQAVAFVYQGKGWVVTGVDNGQATGDFWVFDPSISGGGAWTEKNKIYNASTLTFDDSYTNIERWNATAFVILGTKATLDKAYISTGENNALFSFTWEYDLSTDVWKQKTPFEGVARTGAVGLTVQNRGFIGLGRSNSQPLYDLREFHPNEVYNPND
jgi:N-acetylneuraminic acid mutarotase